MLGSKLLGAIPAVLGLGIAAVVLWPGLPAGAADESRPIEMEAGIDQILFQEIPTVVGASKEAYQGRNTYGDRYSNGIELLLFGTYTSRLGKDGLLWGLRRIGPKPALRPHSAGILGRSARSAAKSF
jgi:hypothetical protein